MKSMLAGREFSADDISRARAGPVGLFPACEVARASCSVLIAEKAPIRTRPLAGTRPLIEYPAGKVREQFRAHGFRPPRERQITTHHSLRPEFLACKTSPNWFFRAALMPEDQPQRQATTSALARSVAPVAAD
ncbi:hypothetical protein E5K00_12950 [Hymenobacter aquaticus]|uniref:Uncharacterized protein n=1 Tax=Hymenobacter aquaticus TaxID=1867101 RepID=A0A4Z0PV71_9BACT|nr:hypothetical protein E5K00_12950 [Hymenobacter aquaticus]